MLNRRVRIRKTVLLAAVSAVMIAPAASAEDIQITPDHVSVVTFSAPAKTVFIGNPAIADVMVIDPTHVFVLGKNLGNTNLIALDAGGREFVNQQVSVFDRSGTMVTVQHGQGQMTMSCTSQRCGYIVVPGDEKAPGIRTDSPTIASQFKSREEVANTAASGETGATGGGTGAQR